MAEEPTHEWLGPGRHRRHGHGGTDVVEPGDHFTPTDRELAAFGDKCAPLDADDTPDEDPLADLRHLGKKTVRELEDTLASGEYDDRLDDVEQVERERTHGERTTALDAIDARREDIAED